MNKSRILKWLGLFSLSFFCGLMFMASMIFIFIDTFISKRQGWIVDYEAYYPFLFAGFIALMLGWASFRWKVIALSLVGGLAGATLVYLVFENSHFLGMEALLYYPQECLACHRFPVFALIWFLIGLSISNAFWKKKDKLRLFWITTGLSALIVFFLMNVSTDIADFFLVNFFKSYNTRENLIAIVMVTGAIVFTGGFMPLFFVCRHAFKTGGETVPSPVSNEIKQ